MQAGQSSDVITVPGCEVSTEFENTELHIVGLFIPLSSLPQAEDYVALRHIAKEISNRKMIEALQKDGYAITFEEVAALTNGDVFNRSHVARVLCAKGYVQDIKHTINTLLGEGNGYYTPAKRLPALTTIRLIKDWGAVAVLAHPFLNMTYEELLVFLPQAKEAGLDAIETRYSEFDEQTTQKAVELAQRFRLLQSGGSDFHGDGKPTIKLGVGHGDLRVPFSFYENLRDCL